MVKRGENRFGGGSFEHLRWLPGIQGLGLWECLAAKSRRARPEEAQELSWGSGKGGTLTMLACLLPGNCTATRLSSLVAGPVTLPVEG